MEAKNRVAEDEKQVIIYTEPNFDLLERVARELDVDLVLSHDIREAEELFNQGVFPPGTEGGQSPKEILFVSQLFEAVQEQGVLPAKFHVYVNDRGFGALPETNVSVRFERRRHKAFQSLQEAVGVAKEDSGMS